MAAERGGTATLDRAHDTALSSAEGSCVLLTVSRPGVTKDVRHLEPGGVHVCASEMIRRCRCWCGWRNLGQQIEGAGRGADSCGGDLQVARGGGQTTVPQQELDGPQIGTGFEEVGGKSVPPMSLKT